ncbi:uncharacterized protein OGAPODRAFT_94376 [Ogataea polymorpha]|uniref:uncharacterized protein n=1 Tax=Ogataea polymorpha TaxID=460523 RepID=UPI0007F409A4|nr:uncharacterized protein OGAPODRAFT_94376 [Ogataea polymorpha]KAG7930608.1 hypothetical protein KL934_004681 [Ogataea polymorpha]OBA15958.1 hypothetical protein OGAPODRAFT_94376 [Ogataea polymorpha]
MAYLTLPPEFVPEAKTVINWVMSFTPLVSYGTTLLSIRRKKSSKGFSIDICATMLIASTLRIFYYINEPFEISLLRQCFVMIFIHVLLLRVAIKYRDPGETAYLRYDESWPEFFRSAWNATDEGSVYGDALEKASNAAVQYARRVSDFCGRLLLRLLFLYDARYIRPFRFWQWDEYSQYMQFLGGLVLSLTAVQLVFGRTEWLGLVFGSCSFLIESTLPLPQILLFQRSRTVENFKTILLLSWLGGDLTKISYLVYGTDNVGFIFVAAAVFQMSLNLVITYQFFYFKHMDTVNLQQVLPLNQVKEEIPMDEFRVPATFSAPSSRDLFSPISSSQFPSPATTPILNPKIDHSRSRSSTFAEHEAKINKSLRKASLSSSVNLETMKKQSSKLNH